ncbi:MAG TPA: ABC transporter ATP-binding protein [Methylomirabilota bacterium]|nr:ABC transporter ATP-binding protein [Methylomirabilota bacterium]
MILEVADAHTYYGTSHVLFGLSLHLRERELVVLLGRNGAGKTTTLRSIMGVTPPRTGSVRFDGREIARRPPYEVAQHGIAFIPDTRRVFGELTVRENLEIAQRRPRDGGRPWTLERVWDLFPKLRELDGRKGRHLSGGEQQMLAIGRALLGNPRLLLMDEPTQGLAPLVIRHLGEQILRLQQEGMTILLSEQNLAFAGPLANRIYVIDHGAIRFEGALADLESNIVVQTRHLLT